MADNYLFLDVDGPLNAVDADHNRRRKLSLSTAYVKATADVDSRGLHTTVPLGFTTEEDYKAVRAARRRHQEARYYGPDPTTAPRKPAYSVFRLSYNPEWGSQLRALAEATSSELVWATTWEKHANEFISPLVGLPQDLRVVTWLPEHRQNVGSLYWKTRRVCEFAAGKRFLWFDDEVTRHDRRYLEETLGRGHSRAHTVATGSGLTPWDLAFARNFLLTPPL